MLFIKMVQRIQMYMNSMQDGKKSNIASDWRDGAERKLDGKN